MDDYLTKPVESGTLIKMVRRIARDGTSGSHGEYATALSAQRQAAGSGSGSGSSGAGSGCSGAGSGTGGGSGGGGGELQRGSSAVDIPELEAKYRQRVRAITRSLKQSAQRRQLPVVTLEAEQLIGLCVLPQLFGVPAWPEWPSGRGHGWPPATRQAASEGLGPPLRTP